MRIIVLGYNSFVGSAIINYFNSMNNIELVCVGRRNSDLHKVVKFEVTDDVVLLNNDVSNLIVNLDLDSESVIINCISMGDLDKCEMNKDSCKMQNYQFVNILYNHLKNYNFKKLIHFSTNAVYDGNNAPYNEKSKCAPVNFYGLVKLKIDTFLLDQEDSRIIVMRPITMYGKLSPGGRPNPTSMIIEKLKNKQNLRLVDDVLVNILYVEDLVKAIEKLIEKDFSGLINISGNEVYSRYDLGLEIAKLLDMKEELIESVTSTEFKTVANRPLDTSFDNTLMKKNGIHPRTLKQTILNLL